ncbi:MAG: hypothetical protein M0Z29_04340, partial [Actinomycetota bacterium]|nr:hypothetical protein [Actinomycetota bacterium]
MNNHRYDSPGGSRLVGAKAGQRSPRLRLPKSLALLAGGALALSACGSAASAASAASANTSASSTGKPTAITLWESHNGGPVGAAMSALVAKFNASHKSVQVTLVVTKASSKLPAAVAAGNPPVLAEISHYDGVLVKGLALQSWNPYIKGSKTFSQANVFP